MKELRELLQKATPGEWAAIETNSHKYMAWVADANDGQIALVGATEGPHLENANANLIAAMKNALPSLLDKVERLERLALRYEWLRAHAGKDDDFKHLDALDELCRKQNRTPTPDEVDAAVDQSIADELAALEGAGHADAEALRGEAR